MYIQIYKSKHCYDFFLYLLTLDDKLWFPRLARIPNCTPANLHLRRIFMFLLARGTSTVTAHYCSTYTNLPERIFANKKMIVLILYSQNFPSTPPQKNVPIWRLISKRIKVYCRFQKQPELFQVEKKSNIFYNIFPGWWVSF
jgi:hypothetical protein